MTEELFDASGKWQKNVQRMRSMIGLSIKKVNSLFKKEQAEFTQSLKDRNLSKDRMGMNKK